MLEKDPLISWTLAYSKEMWTASGKENFFELSRFCSWILLLTGLQGQFILCNNEDMKGT